MSTEVVLVGVGLFVLTISITVILIRAGEG